MRLGSEVEPELRCLRHRGDVTQGATAHPPAVGKQHDAGRSAVPAAHRTIVDHAEASASKAVQAQALARFYQRLLGWEISNRSPTWVEMLMRDPRGRGTSSNLAFQLEPEYEPPSWSSHIGRQQMQVHVDVGVADVAAAVEEAIAIGATVADHQPQQDVRVVLDPPGHPFCLYQDTPPLG